MSLSLPNPGDPGRAPDRAWTSGVGPDPRGGAGSLAAAVVCPHPPALVPELAGGAAGELAGLRAACDRALAVLVDSGARRVVVVGSAGEHSMREYRPPVRGSFAPWGVSLDVVLTGPRSGDSPGAGDLHEPGGSAGAAGAGDAPEDGPEDAPGEPPGPGEVPAGAGSGLPLSLLIGAWLLSRIAPVSGLRPDRLLAVDPAAPPARCAAIGAALGADQRRLGGRWALLVMGDGTACLEADQPGRRDRRAAAYDALVAQALAGGDPERLLALDEPTAADLVAAGRAPWQVLAGAARESAARWRADLLHHEAPFGVAYYVAGWRPVDGDRPHGAVGAGSARIGRSVEPVVGVGRSVEPVVEPVVGVGRSVGPVVRTGRSVEPVVEPVVGVGRSVEPVVRAGRSVEPVVGVGRSAEPAGSAGPARVDAELPGPVLAIVGPTAAGKSALGIALARQLGGEVVNADSMQLYRGMDIGTAKVTAAERAGVPHHLLDIWEVTEPASVVAYRDLARAAIGDILARGRVPLLVGGSGLYLRAVLEEFDFPGTDPALRARLEAELAQDGPAGLHARLRGVDPAAAAAILPSNGRRIVRALEVVALTGRAFTAQLPPPRPVYRAVHLGVDRQPAALDELVGLRVERMWRAGLVDEVRALLPLGLADGRTASRALGYQQILHALAGGCTEAQAQADTVRATRRFVRRQRSWFRRDPRISWLDGARPDLAAVIAHLRSLPEWTA